MATIMNPDKRQVTVHNSTLQSGAFAAQIKQIAHLFLLSGILVMLATGLRAEPVTVLALGDSLTAGYGLAPEDGFTNRLQDKLQAEGHDVIVRNAGVSGDTSTGGLARLDWVLSGQADVALVELGANDALRGTDPQTTRNNLDEIVSRLKSRNIPVLLAGMQAPKNWGPEYETAFNAIYPDLAKQHAVPLYPFFLEGVAADPALNQADGIHPNPQGVQIIVDRIAPHVIKLITSLH